MTSRRRVATFSFSPAADDGAADVAVNAPGNKSALERKLELLEARFTMPLDQQLNGANTTNGSNNNNNSSPDTLGEDSSPASVTTTVANNQNNNNTNPHSQQSFGFDTPSLSYSNSSSRMKNKNRVVLLTKEEPEDIAAPAAAAAASGPSKYENEPHVSTTTTASKGGWQDVATAHIAKVAQLQQQQQQQQQQSQHRHNEVDDDDDHTIITSHVRPAVCIKESPPFLSPKATAASSTNTINNNTTMAVMQAQPPNNKRKSIVPTKRNQPTVRDPAAAASGSDATAEPQEAARKRTKLHFDNSTSMSSTTATTTTATKKKVSVGEAASKQSKNGSSHANDKQQQTRADNNGNSRSNSPFRRLVNSNNSNSRPENSRDATSTAAASKQNKKGAASNNTKIHDFFSAAQKSTHHSSKAAAVSAVPRRSGSSATQSTTNQATSVATNVTKSTTADVNQESVQPRQKATSTPRRTENADATALTIDHLQQQLRDLQRACDDKDEQLKAVSNNRTILHSALQAAVRQRDQELADLQESSSEREARTLRVLEDLVRTDACQEARELRQKLAADGARLGRIVAAPAPSRGPPRLLMQRAVVESWEDGHASKQLQQKRSQLHAKRVVLEERQRAAVQAEQRVLQLQAHQQVQGEKDGDDDDSVPVVGGMEIRTALDAREAVESVNYLLSNLRQQEKELALEDQSLNDEKGDHIRALKRVASEDASRFRSRPMLHDRYVLCSLLGKGGFSEVWRAYDLTELREVAVKIHQLDPRWPDSKKENYTKHVSREYEIHRNVRHPRIVSLYDVFEIDTDSFATVLEFCDGTDLDTLLKTKRRLPERDARAILLQVLSGMRYLSQPSADGSRQGIIHYDLKPGNILFDENGDAKITDFGLSKIVDTPDSGDSMELTSQGAGTYWYLPPECFFTEENVRISNKVDVWSIGVIFYQMLYGKRPFGDGLSQDKILADGTMLNAHEVKFPDKPDNITEGCKGFIRACLTYDQSFRPSIARLCEHSYVLAKELASP